MQGKNISRHWFIFLCFLIPFTIKAQVWTGSSDSTITPEDKEAVRVAGQVTDFTMQPGEVDQTIIFKDPANEQTVLFDMLQGGAIVSFKYQNIEHIWGYNGGGLLQMAFHNSRNDGPWEGDYNPTQAGDGTNMSPVTGVACYGSDSLDIITVMLDFNHNNGFYPHPLLAVCGGRVDTTIPTSYSSPYTLETIAHWVPNPGGEPKYYLKLDERITHLTNENMGPLGYDFADYQDWKFNVRAISPENCPCDPSLVNYMSGGWYSDTTRKEGLAIAMPNSNFKNSKIDAGFNSDYMWRNHSFHLSASEALDGVASKYFVWYVMVGSWDQALQFSKKLGVAGGVQ
ncbi:MAG: hypothetical protein WCA84_01470 [Ignavibacteriaceae bacterium]